MLYCDNEGALENVFDEFPKRGIYPLLARDYDLLGMARALLKRIPVKVTGCWVKGHYKGEQREVSHNLNDIADQLAEQFRLSPPAGYTPRRMPSLHPDYEALLYLSGATVTTAFKNIIYRQVFSSDLEANIMRRTGWTPQQFQRISWEEYDAAFRGQTTFQQIDMTCGTQGSRRSDLDKMNLGSARCAMKSLKRWTTFSNVGRSLPSK